MTTDAWLAITHHIAVFGLLAVLAAELGLVWPGLRAGEVRRVGRIDGFYGVAAVAVIAAGVARVIWGDQPASFYLENPVFWLKMAAFGTVGLLSIGPTMRYIRWRNALKADEGDLPADSVVDSTRRFVVAQLAVFPLIPIFAALMARGIGR